MSTPYKVRSLPNTSIYTIITLVCILLISLSSTLCFGETNHYNNLSVEVILNKSDIGYDLAPLIKYNETEGSVNIIRIEEPIEDVTEDIIKSEVVKDYTIPLEPGNVTDFDVNWPPGVYYLFRSHLNWDVTVLIYEVSSKDRIPDVSGLSINFIIPTQPLLVKKSWEVWSLDLSSPLLVDLKIMEFMVNLGYQEFGTSIISQELTKMEFIKDDLKILISSINNSSSEDTLGEGSAIISIDGPNGSIGQQEVQDIEKVLEFLKLDPTIWENATYSQFDKVEFEYLPTFPIDLGVLNWSEILSTEFGWLTNESIITGLSKSDIDQILGLAENVNVSLNPSIYFSGDVWSIVFKNDSEYSESIFLMNNAWCPPFPPGNGLISPSPIPTPQPKNGDYYWLFYITAAVIIIVLIGLFSYSRIKRRLILDNCNRKKIFEYIKSNQGIHFNKILRELEFQPGALSYHLNVLEKGEYIKSIQDGSHRRFYLYGTKSDFKIILTTIQQRILSIVYERPGISQTNISKIIGRNKMVINYHIKILNDADLISLEKEGRERKIFTTKNAAMYLSV